MCLSLHSSCSHAQELGSLSVMFSIAIVNGICSLHKVKTVNAGKEIEDFFISNDRIVINTRMYLKII